MELLVLLVTYLFTPSSFCHSATAAFYTLQVNPQPLFHPPLPTETSTTNIFRLLLPLSFLYMFTSSLRSKYRHIVYNPACAISYASVSHMVLPVRHALVPHTHKLCVCVWVCVWVCVCVCEWVCVSIFNFTLQIAHKLLDWNKLLHLLPRKNFPFLLLKCIHNNLQSN